VNRQLPWAPAVAVLVLVSGCGASADRDDAAPATASTATEAPAARLVDPAEFAAAVDAGRRVTVNVHVPFEGAVEGTDLSIPFDRVRADRGRLPQDRATPLAVYCRSGSMSASAVTDLAELGYTDIVELDGGMNAWTEAGLPLLSRPESLPS